MKKEQAARLLTVLVLGAALGWTLWRREPAAAPVSPAEPTAPLASGPAEQDTVYAMFDAAREGRVDGYLNAYTGALRASLEQAAKEQGAEKFGAYLRDQAAAVKGLALQEPQRLNHAQSRLKLEYVYQDRTESQKITLDKVEGVWRISRIDAAERVKTLVPYGTPVY